MNTNKPLVAITGASSGIGAAIAQHFSQAGHPVLLMGRRKDRLEALNLENAIVAVVNVNDRAQTEAAIRAAEARHGPTDCLVNNAGMMLLGEIDTQDPSEWQKMLDVNVTALLNTTQVVLGDMKARKGGTIINISSAVAGVASPYNGPYAVAKSGVNSLTQTLAAEMATLGIRVNGVHPTVVMTEMSAWYWGRPDIEGPFLSQMPLGRWATVDEIAAPIVFLMSGGASMITGVSLPIDGGFTAV